MDGLEKIVPHCQFWPKTLAVDEYEANRSCLNAATFEFGSFMGDFYGLFQLLCCQHIRAILAFS